MGVDLGDLGVLYGLDADTLDTSDKFDPLIEGPLGEFVANLSLDGEPLCGLVGREDEFGEHGPMLFVTDMLAGDGTVMDRKVSTKRDLITLSRPLCELSGSIADKRAAGLARGDTLGKEDVAWKLTDEPVLGRLAGRNGAAIPLTLRLDDPAFIPGPKLPPLEKLTLEPNLILPRCWSGLPTSMLSRPTPSSEFLLRRVFNEFADILRLRLRFRVRSKSSDRCPCASNWDCSEG